MWLEQKKVFFSQQNFLLSMASNFKFFICSLIQIVQKIKIRIKLVESQRDLIKMCDCI